MGQVDFGFITQERVTGKSNEAIYRSCQNRISVAL